MSCLNSTFWSTFCVAAAYQCSAHPPQKKILKLSKWNKYQASQAYNKSNVPPVFTGLDPNVLQYIIWYTEELHSDSIFLPGILARAV